MGERASRPSGTRGRVTILSAAVAATLTIAGGGLSRPRAGSLAEVSLAAARPIAELPANATIRGREFVRRLTPERHPGLSRAVRRYLLRNGYAIPQSSERSRPHNVITGSFLGRGQRDVAVLCSRGGYSEILVFSNGSTSAPLRLGREEDSSIRAIDPVGADYIRQHYARYGGPKPPARLDHQGIDDGADGKASGVWYRHRGRWLQLSGAD